MVKIGGLQKSRCIQQLMAGAQQADFKLEPYLSYGQVSLSDYKGKVVLLTFWFPGCGPCRDEFPHFEKVLKGFREQPVSYVGINMARQQDSYVIPFVKKQWLQLYATERCNS